MKKLLLILLSLPFIGFGQNIIKPQQEIKEAIIPPDDRILKILRSASSLIVDPYFDRKKMLFYERKMEGDGFKNLYLSNAYNEINQIEAVIEYLRGKKKAGKSEIKAVNVRIIEWNTKTVYEKVAAQKNYNIGDILSNEFEHSTVKSSWFKEDPFNLDILYRTKRTYNEAKEEGSLQIYILREIASKIIYPILILLFIVLIKYVIRKKRRREIKQ